MKTSLATTTLLLLLTHLTTAIDEPQCAVECFDEFISQVGDCQETGCICSREAFPSFMGCCFLRNCKPDEGWWGPCMGKVQDYTCTEGITTTTTTITTSTSTRATTSTSLTTSTTTSEPTTFDNNNTIPPTKDEISNTTTNSSSSSAIGLGVGLGLGIPLTLAVIGTLAFLFWRARRQQTMGERGLLPAEVHGDAVSHELSAGEKGRPECVKGPLTEMPA